MDNSFDWPISGKVVFDTEVALSNSFSCLDVVKIDIIPKLLNHGSNVIVNSDTKGFVQNVNPLFGPGLSVPNLFIFFKVLITLSNPQTSNCGSSERVAILKPFFFAISRIPSKNNWGFVSNFS